MKNFQRSLFVIIAAALCGLCVYQWHIQTAQRSEIQMIADQVYQRDLRIQSNTNSIKALDAQVAQLQSQIKEVEQTNKTNQQLVSDQKREISELRASARGYTNQVTEYKKAVAQMEGKLKEAYDGIAKQNVAVKELVQQRDQLVAKLNDSISQYNLLTTNYNKLVQRIENSEKATSNK